MRQRKFLARCSVTVLQLQRGGEVAQTFAWFNN
jgi:hypothetical protein